MTIKGEWDNLKALVEDTKALHKLEGKTSVEAKHLKPEDVYHFYNMLISGGLEVCYDQNCTNSGHYHINGFGADVYQYDIYYKIAKEWNK